VLFAAPIVVAGLLIFSAAAKAANRRDTERAVRLLVGKSGGADRAGLASATVAASVIVEWAIAACLLLWPASLVVRGSVILLFGAFAALGVLAIVSGRSIDCGCFGAVRTAPLGWLQICELAVVLLAALLLFPSANWPMRSAVAALFLVHVAVAVALVLAVLPHWRRVRQQRLSLLGAATADWRGRLTR
jgi:hypothetical protein